MSNRPSFAITSFNIEGFRGIKNASVEGIPADTKWIFLTGKNGGGKTSVLQALFVGLLGNIEDTKILEKGIYNVEIKLKTLNGDELNFKDFQKITDTVNHLDIIKKSNQHSWTLNPVWNNAIVAYGAVRTHIYGSNSDFRDKYNRSQSLFGSNNILLNIESELKNWVYRSSSEEVKQRDKDLANRLESRAKKLQVLLLKLMPNLQKIEIDMVQDKVLYYEKDDSGSIITDTKTFDQLASGNRSIIAMIGDLVIRLLEGQPEISDPSDLEGIVLIDELDVHLHPTWQKALPGLLSEIFPKIQFIASTHSPIPLLGAPKESVVLKVHQSSDEGITVEKLDIDVTQLLPNSLLTSPIFDLEEIIPTANTSPKDLLTEDSFQEAMANEDVKNRLKKIAQALK